MRAGFLLLLAGLICASGAQPGNQSTSQTSSSQIGYKSAADADKKKTLLLKDFHPVWMLHAPAHEIERAKFYVIGVHNHGKHAQGIGDRIPLPGAVEGTAKT